MRIPVNRYWRLLARYLRPQRRLLALLGSLLLSGVLFRLVAPLLAALFVNIVIGGSVTSLTKLILLAIAICVAGVLDQVCMVAGTQVGTHISWTATNRLREDLAEHCLDLDLEFQNEHGPGQMIERIDGDARELTNFFAQFAVKLMVNLTIVFGVLCVVIWIDWAIGLAYFAMSVLAVYVFNRFRSYASPHWQLAREASTDLYGQAEEWFGGMPDIHVNAADAYIRRRFAAGLKRLFQHNRRATTVTIGISHASDMVLSIGTALILGLAVVLYRSGAMNYGLLVALLLYLQIISLPLDEISEELGDLQRSTASVARIEELFNTKSSVVTGPGASFGSGALGVIFDDVSFRYPGSDQANGAMTLQDISFELKPGEILGVIGRTGSGKTTLTRLLQRFYDPVSGQIRLDGHDVRDATLAELRSAVGMVTQEVQLFNASVRDNLTMFKDGIPDDTLLSLLTEIGLGAWLDRQSDGLDTILPPGGGGLSADEAQLLAAARIFVMDPGLVILDEPSGRLDPKSEELVQAALRRLLHQRTGLMIAHHLDTLRMTDKILVLEGGRIAEYGPRLALELDPATAYHRTLVLAAEGPAMPVDDLLANAADGSRHAG